MKFDIGYKVKILDEGSTDGWTFDMEETIGKLGIVLGHDELCDVYLVETDGGVKWWYSEDNLELVNTGDK